MAQLSAQKDYSFASILDRIEELAETMDTVDVMLIVGEEFPRDIGQEALVEARKRGIL